MKRYECPNCTSPVAGHPKNGCVLAALIQVVRDRGNTPERKLLGLHAAVDADNFWEAIGPIVDRLEDGLL